MSEQLGEPQAVQITWSTLMQDAGRDTATASLNTRPVFKVGVFTERNNDDNDDKEKIKNPHTPQGSGRHLAEFSRFSKTFKRSSMRGKFLFMFSSTQFTYEPQFELLYKKRSLHTAVVVLNIII